MKARLILIFFIIILGSGFFFLFPLPGNAEVLCKYEPKDAANNPLATGYSGENFFNITGIAWKKLADSSEQCETWCNEALRSCGENNPLNCSSVQSVCGVVSSPGVGCQYIPRRSDGGTLDKDPGSPPGTLAGPWIRTPDSVEICNSFCRAALNACEDNRPSGCDPEKSLCSTKSGAHCQCCEGGTRTNPMSLDQCKEECQRYGGGKIKTWGGYYTDCGGLSPSTPTAPTPYQFKSITPKLQIPLPTLPSFSEFTDLTLQGEVPNRYLWIPWIGQYIAAIYKYAIGIVGVLAGIMIVVGGLLWLTAGGSAERVSTAKSFIESSLVGLVIALTSYLLLYVINPNLVGFESLKVKYIERAAPEAGGGGMEARGEITSGGAGSAQAFRAISCDGLAESGEEFEAFFTSYYVPSPYGNPSGYTGIASNTATGASLNDSMKDFFCAVAMECSCPNGEKDTSYKCYSKSGVFAKGGARDGWWPCKAFSRETSYCGTDDTLSDGQLRHRPGETVAADCNCTSHRSGECKIEVTLRNGSKKILQVTDTGSGIRGRRFDYFTTIGGEKLSGVFKVKFLPGCTPAGEYGVPRGSACTFAPPSPGPLGPQPAGTTSTTSEGKIAVIGDSITADGTQYQSYLRSNCIGKTIEVFAQVGQQTSWMLEQFRNNVKGKGFNGLIILGGVNDLSSGRTSSQIQNNLNTIYTEAKADGIKVTAVAVLPWKDYSRWDATKQTNTEALNRWILSSTADVKVNAYAEFGDSSDSAKLKSIYDPGDHLHPNAAGSRKLGEIIVNAGACR